MVYQPVHPRKVLGVKVHDTIKERQEKRNVTKGNTEVHVKGSKIEFLVPNIDNFVETEQVKRITERIMRWIKIGYPPHIIGPTGCGKTTLALAVANKVGRPTLWINGDDEMTTSNLIGGYSEIETSSVRDRYIHRVIIAKDSSKYTWVDNPLTIACKQGYTLIYNEFSRARPVANNVLLSVLEEGILELPIIFGEERYVKVHPDFSIIFTSNSIEYAGVHRPQDALLDRLVHIYMDYYDFDTEVEIVAIHTGLPAEEAERIVRAVRVIRERMPRELKPGTRAAIMIGKGLNAMGDHSNDTLRQICSDVLASKIGDSNDFSKQATLIEDVLLEVY